MDGRRFCRACAPQYYQQRRERELQQVTQGGMPVALFFVPRIRTRSPDRPHSRALHLGVLAFMDKGVCFVQIARADPADHAVGLVFEIMGQTLGTVLGLIWNFIAEAQAKANRVRAQAEAEEWVRTHVRDLGDLLARANRLLFYPRREITGLTLSGGGYFEIKTANGSKGFRVAGDRKERKHFRGLVEAYWQAIRSGGDPALAFKPAPAAPLA
jgi:hypothetical protein